MSDCYAKFVKVRRLNNRLNTAQREYSKWNSK